MLARVASIAPFVLLVAASVAEASGVPLGAPVGASSQGPAGGVAAGAPVHEGHEGREGRAGAFAGGGMREASPEVRALVAELERALRGGERADAASAAERAGRVVRELHGRFASSPPADRRAIADGLRACLGGGVGDAPSWQAVAARAANGLGTMGADGARVLRDAVGGGELEEDPELLRRAILALGRTREPAALGELLERIRHPLPAIAAAAGEALGEFDNLEGERRKSVFHELLRALLAEGERLERDPLDPAACRRYEAVIGPFTASLQRLSGHDERDPRRWQRFWNEHRHDDWDEPRT